MMLKKISINIAALLFAAIIFSSIIVFINSFHAKIVEYKYIEDDNKSINYIPTITDQHNAIDFPKEKSFEYGFKNNHVILFGSSELTSRAHKFIPYNFLTKNLNIPTIGVGKAHFELLAIYGYLSAYQEYLNKDSRIVIILSPGWFEKTDLLPQAYNSHFPSYIANKLANDENAKNIFSNYLNKNKNDFKNLNSTQLKLIYKDNIIVSSVTNSLNYIADARVNIQNIINDNHKIKVENIYVSHEYPLMKKQFEIANTEVQWLNLANDAKNIELNNMSKETQWVNKKYYEKYVKDKKSKKAFPNGINYSKEIHALDNLLNLLAKYNVDALFIMQPLNPYVYTDTNNFNPVENIISEKVKSHSMGYLNLIEEQYQPGVLTDIMHMGEYGWLLTDKAIVEHFAK
ncbi:D-alanyl-lipoteichoic acid biosynthesis protein DltD [Photorhabdus aegyptia]|uniref:D-alanine transfer protein, teichoic and lipoteichoic acid D-alanine esterification n=1 Tax=Photorhabdus aegyptia TaxID=2805098 RepID=A0A022PHJ9_9GAMM|nr:D-alanyl-lipoteichoic acid biosynthesis protein DltD [Photorhabdus aegyptia]EYU15612.1 D-alanine transfer protein, teichoic and lipoteichoic acid D-alanine esterification [Photorhabdus aegyptia]